MNFSRYGLVSAALFLFLAFYASPSLADDADALIDKALKLSGITGQIEMLGKTILSAVPADAFPDQKARNEAEALIRKRASKEALTEMVRASVRRQFDKDKIEKVVRFYESSFGRKVGRLQDNALETGLLKSIREGRKTAASLDETRLKTLARIIDAEIISESNDILVKSVVRGLLDGSTEGANRPNDETDQINEKLKAVEKTMAMEQHRMDDMALTAFALTYRSLSDKELEELAAYQESAAASWFRDAVLNGLDSASYEVSRALGASLTASRNAGRSDKASDASGIPGNSKTGRDE
jgi:hypothetical protein